MRIHFLDPHDPKNGKSYFGDTTRIDTHPQGFLVKTLNMWLWIPWTCVIAVWVNRGEYMQPSKIPVNQPWEWETFLDFIGKKRNLLRKKIRLIL